MNFVKEQNVAGIRRNLKFSPRFANYLASRDYDFYGEPYFNTMLELERKRTERSKKPFLLMLLDVKAFEKTKNRAGLIEKIAYTLCSSTRKIDIKGWYRRGMVFGVVFTELNGVDEALKMKITEKVGHSLSAVLRPDELQKVKITVHAFPEDKGQKGGKGNIFDFYLYPDLSRKSRSRRMSLVLKRIIDVFGSVMALVVLSPLFLLIAFWIKKSSDGPVFFRQERVGLAGKEFTFLKFRSMYTNSDPKRHIDYISKYIGGDKECNRGEGAVGRDGVFKIKDDPRITPFGRFLRKTSLDELPQFINVLKGDMSLVGPRPPIAYECEKYDIWHRRRVLEVKPGLTGLWQVKGRSATAFDDMVRLDLKYVKEWSIWLDLKIMFQTPGTVVACKGAY
jgi:exopolysaccharide biosynthesis polyprenyl glycosylphosphotransferase